MAIVAANGRRFSNARRFQRVAVDLYGMCMLADGREGRCRIIDMSPGGVAVAALIHAFPRERVIVYADHLGRLEGAAVRACEDGFAMTIVASQRKRDKLAAQLTWLANRKLLGDDHTRRHERTAPVDPRSALMMPHRALIPCAVIDMSASGAAIACTTKPPVGMLVTIGRIQSRVVRHFDIGFVVEFTRLRDPRLLEANLAGPFDLPDPAPRSPHSPWLDADPRVPARAGRRA
jgi:hypothetical protein